MKRLSAAFLLAVFALSAYPSAAQPTPRAVDPLPLIGPVKGGTVYLPTVQFNWSEYAPAATFVLTIWNEAGTQTASQSYPNAGCDGACSFDFVPADHGWVWKEGALYVWQVKAKDGGGTVLAKSKKWSFVADMLQPITLIDPAAGALVQTDAGGLQDGNRLFRWSDTGADYYKVTVYNMNGTIFSSRQVTSTYCGGVDGECEAYMNFQSLDLGQIKKFTWQVIGSRDFVKGKGKSPKQEFRIQRAAI